MKRLFACLLTLSMISAARADVTLPVIIDNKMVLQRETQAPIWGWADAGEEVTVTFAGQTKKAMPGTKGLWMVKLDPMQACAKSAVMTIKGKNTITLTDVLVGEVWLASGQSNMEFSIGAVPDGEKEVIYAQKNNPLLRMFCVTGHFTASVELDDTVGSWTTAPEFSAMLKSGKISGFSSHSAVGCFFGLKLQQELGVPVAIIDSTWGGRRIEQFISDAGFDAFKLNSKRTPKDQYPQILEKYKKAVGDMQKAQKAAEQGRMNAISLGNIFGRVDNGIYNAMIAPLAPFAIKGAIWYQGESNRGAKDYFVKLQALSASWSKAFNVKDIPFYQVQIAPFDYSRGKDNANTTLCDSIWTAQYKSAAEIKGMGVVSIHDVNIPIKNIHPPCKQLVGDRLAAQALKNQYGKNVTATGPSFDAARLSGTKVMVSFKDVDQGLSTTDGKDPIWFELSSDGKTFVKANAVIKGDKVAVSAAEVKDPKFVRMGWADIAIPTLKDKNGWPVFAFGTQPVK